MRLPPEQFWALSLTEWWLMTGAGDAEALSRAAFDQLRNLYPDEPK